MAPNFSWRENGPIQLFFQKKISQEFFNTRFSRDDECLIVLNGMFSSQSNAELQRKLKRLAREFDLLNNDDAALDLAQSKRHHTGTGDARLAIRSFSAVRKTGIWQSKTIKYYYINTFILVYGDYF